MSYNSYRYLDTNLSLVTRKLCLRESSTESKSRRALRRSRFKMIRSPTSTRFRIEMIVETLRLIKQWWLWRTLRELIHSHTSASSQTPCQTFLTPTWLCFWLLMRFAKEICSSKRTEWSMSFILPSSFWWKEVTSNPSNHASSRQSEMPSTVSHILGFLKSSSSSLSTDLTSLRSHHPLVRWRRFRKPSTCLFHCSKLPLKTSKTCNLSSLMPLRVQASCTSRTEFDDQV